MALPVSGSLVQDRFLNLWDSIVNLRSYCLLVQGRTVGGVAIAATDFLSVASACVEFRQLVAAVQGSAPLLAAIVAYANSQTASTGLTAADFGSANTAAGALLTALGNEYPHNVGGLLLDRSFSVADGLHIVTLTAAQMPNTMTAMATFLATLS